MKRLTSTSFAAIAAGFLAFSAPAARSSDLLDGLNEPAPAQTQVNHTGIWAAALGGMSFFNTEMDWNFDGGPFVPPVDFLDVDGLGSEGLFGEAQVGLDYQINSLLVARVMGGVNTSDAEFSASVFDGSLLSISASYDWGSVLGGGLCLVKSASTMFCGVGGWAHAKLNNVNGTFMGTPYSLETQDLNGWFGDISMETELTDSVSLVVSGRYTDYGSEALVIDPASSIEIDGLDTDSLAVMVGLKAKLGGF
jgi:hypothetical protein